MMDNLPLISIGMPVFNSGQTLRDAMNSIGLQTYENWELIVIDDGSTDDTAEIVRGYDDKRIRFFFDGENRGLAARLNEAINTARGDYFARMDGDDLAYPDRLEKQLSYLQLHPEVDLVGGWALVFDQRYDLRGKRKTPEQHEWICREPWKGFPIIHPTFMGKTEWFKRFGYDPTRVRAQDQVLLADSFLKSRLANLQEIVLAYREDIPSFEKQWSSRRHLLIGMLTTYLSQHLYWWALCTLVNQITRMVVDFASTLITVKFRRIARRSTPLSPDELIAWNKLIAELNQQDRVERLGAEYL